MGLRWIFVMVVALGVPSFAFAGEQSGVVRRVSCSVVRFYVAKYSEMAAEQWARTRCDRCRDRSGAALPTVDTAAPPGRRQGRLRSAPTAGDGSQPAVGAAVKPTPQAMIVAEAAPQSRNWIAARHSLG